MISDKWEDPEEQQKKKKEQEDWGVVKSNRKRKVIANKSSLSTRVFLLWSPRTDWSNCSQWIWIDERPVPQFQWQRRTFSYRKGRSTITWAATKWFWQHRLNADCLWVMSLVDVVLSHNPSGYHLCRILSITLGNISWLPLGGQYLTAVSRWKHNPGAPALSLCSAKAATQQLRFSGSLNERAKYLHALQLVKSHSETLSQSLWCTKSGVLNFDTLPKNGWVLLRSLAKPETENLRSHCKGSLWIQLQARHLTGKCPAQRNHRCTS